MFRSQNVLATAPLYDASREHAEHIHLSFRVIGLLMGAQTQAMLSNAGVI